MSTDICVLLAVQVFAAVSLAAGPVYLVETVTNTTNEEQPQTAQAIFSFEESDSCVLAIGAPLYGSGACSLVGYEKESGKIELVLFGPLVTIKWIGVVRDVIVSGTYEVKGFFRTPGIPARIEAKIPSVCVVAALVGVANHFGFGPFTVFPLSHHSEPFMPGDRTCNGGAFTFQIPGALAIAENVAIPMRVQDAASIRCIYAYLQQGTSDGQSAYLVKISRDDGATWEPLEYMGIAQSVPAPYKNTYDLLVESEGYGKPDTRRLPYNDFGIVLVQAVTAGGSPQTVSTASYGANRLGLDVGEFVHVGLGTANEEYVQVLVADPDHQTFTAVFTKNRVIGERVRPTIWPTPILREGDDLAFDILAVASPDPGADLTVVAQT